VKVDTDVISRSEASPGARGWVELW